MDAHFSLRIEQVDNQRRTALQTQFKVIPVIPFLMILGDTGAIVAVPAESADVLETSINTGFLAKQM